MREIRVSLRVEQYSNLQLINGRITELYVLYQEDNFDTNFDELIANMVDNSIRVWKRDAWASKISMFTCKKRQKKTWNDNNICGLHFLPPWT